MRTRRVRIALWRQLTGRLSPTAIEAGNGRGLNLDAYQRDRDGLGAEALDRALLRQADELTRDIAAMHGARALYTLMSCHARGTIGKSGGPAARAEFIRQTAEQANKLGEQLRELARTADAVAYGLRLRAEDHDAERALDDRLAGLREDG